MPLSAVLIGTAPDSPGADTLYVAFGKVNALVAKLNALASTDVSDFVAAATAAAPVQSVAGRTGAVTLGTADVAGAAPIDSPAFLTKVTLPSWSAAPSTAAGVIGYNSSTGRYEFGIGGSIVNHVRLTGDTMSGPLVLAGLSNTSLAIGQTATHTTQGTAETLSSDINVLSSVAVGSGKVLPAAVGGRQIEVFNRDTSVSASIWPAVGGQIESNATNAPVVIAAGASARFRAISTTQWLMS